MSPAPVTVQEILNSGGYSYLRCNDGRKDLWLAVMEVSLQPGEVVSYQDTSPIYNFTSKTLGRTFPEIRFVPGISGSEGPRPPAPAKLRGGTDPSSDESGIYRGTDDSGALVFTDDPGKVVKKPRKK